jgi:hypothetical protein
MRTLELQGESGVCLSLREEHLSVVGREADISKLWRRDQCLTELRLGLPKQSADEPSTHVRDSTGVAPDS